MPESVQVGRMIYDLAEEERIIFAGADDRLVQISDLKSFYVYFHADLGQVLFDELGGLGELGGGGGRDGERQGGGCVFFILAGHSLFQKSARPPFPSVFGKRRLHVFYNLRAVGAFG